MEWVICTGLWIRGGTRTKIEGIDCTLQILQWMIPIYLQVDENLDIGRQLKAETRQIEEDLAREREEQVRAKQAMRVAVVDARANVAVAAEKVAIEKRNAAEEERQKKAADAKVCAMTIMNKEPGGDLADDNEQGLGVTWG